MNKYEQMAADAKALADYYRDKLGKTVTGCAVFDAFHGIGRVCDALAEAEKANDAKAPSPRASTLTLKKG